MNQPIFTSGSSTIQRVLPCFSGYAMGGIIRTKELDLPYLRQLIVDLGHQIEEVKAEKERLAKENSVGLTQEQVSSYFFRTRELTKKVEKYAQQISQYESESEDLPFSEEMLPVDYRQSVMDISYRSHPDENMHHITVKGPAAKKQVQDFTQHLTRMHYVPVVVSLVNRVAQSILNEVRQGNQEVELLGSFITLPHVRVIDPIVIREDAKLSEELIRTADKYSVITEAVLGAVFIGFGIKKELTDSKEGGETADTSSLRTFSFVSQGAIPPTKGFDLRETYNRWKEELLSNPRSGFPIAFKVRKLTDILKENRIRT